MHVENNPNYCNSCGMVLECTILSYQYKLTGQHGIHGAAFTSPLHKLCDTLYYWYMHSCVKYVYVCDFEGL